MKKNNVIKKRPLNPKPSKKPRKLGLEADSFFLYDKDSKRRRKLDEEIESEDSDKEEEGGGRKFGKGDEEDGDEEESEEETVAEKKLRLTKEFVLKQRKQAEKMLEEEGESDEDDDEDEDERVDSIVAQRLQKEQLEDSGRVMRLISSRVQKPETSDGFRLLLKHRQSVTAVALSEDDVKGFSASKDGTIVQWDVEKGHSEKYAWPNEEVMRSHGAKEPQKASKWSRHILDIAVSSDGRYLATGGLDRHVHLWDSRTREHIRAFPGHKGRVSCLTFRQGTSELFSGSLDRIIKSWNADDRCYVTDHHGHQAEIVTVDCSRRGRILSVGRDRTMHLWNVTDAKQLVYRARAASIECGVFVSNDVFLSGCDDGSIEFWRMLKKKPVFVVKNAHAAVAPIVVKDEGLPNGDYKGNGYCSSALSWVSAVTVCRNSDLAASGAGNGLVRLWSVDCDEKTSDEKRIQPLYGLPLVGFVNSLAFAKSGRFLVAGVGQEPRLGRWGKIPGSRNGVFVQSLNIIDEGKSH